MVIWLCYLIYLEYLKKNLQPERENLQGVWSYKRQNANRTVSSQ